MQQSVDAVCDSRDYNVREHEILKIQQECSIKSHCTGIPTTMTTGEKYRQHGMHVYIIKPY